jgi:hypothetical protein
MSAASKACQQRTFIGEPHTPARFARFFFFVRLVAVSAEGEGGGEAAKEEGGGA